MNQTNTKKTKFNYLVNQKQRLMNQYISLNNSPNINNTKYQYHDDDYDFSNQKQNIIKNHVKNTNTIHQQKIVHNNNKSLKKNNQDKSNQKRSLTQTLRLNTFGKNVHNIEFSPFQIQTEQQTNNNHNLLINEYEQRFILVKKQLSQYEYQNELLRQKIKYFQNENIELKREIIMKDQKIIYYEKIREGYQDQKEKYEILVDQMKEEIKILLTKNSMLEDEIKLKSEQLIRLKTEGEIKLFKQRRKSLDLSIQGRYKDFVIERPSQNCQQKRQNSLKKRSHYIGKLMNKNTNNNNIDIDNDNSFKRNNHCDNRNEDDQFNQNHNQSKSNSKSQNFIESIKNMYLKINQRQVSDLKLLWKWLKNMAHEQQIIRNLKVMKESFLNILEDLEIRMERQSDLSEIERQSHRILLKIVDFLFNTSER